MVARRRLGIDEVEVVPGEKSAVAQKHKAAGQVVAMAGDGVNYACRDVTVHRGDLTRIVRARACRRQR